MPPRSPSTCARPQVQRRLAADRGELPLRGRAHLRSGHGGRVSVASSSRSSAAPSSPASASTRKGTRASTPPRSTRRPGPHSASRPLDDLTLQIDLTNPAPYFHTVACTVGLLSRSSRRSWRPTRTTGGRRAENHIGNGPFTITGIDEDQRMDLRRQRELLAGPAQARRHRLRLRRGRRRRPRGLPRRRPRHRRTSSRRRSRRCKPIRSCPRSIVTYPTASTYQHGDEPQPGAIQRPEGARGVRLRVRPRDLLRRSPLRRLHA